MDANFKAVQKSGGDVEKQLDLMRNKVDTLRDAVEFSKESFTDLTGIINENIKELEKQKSPIADALKLRRSTRNISKEILYDEQGITSLGEKDLKTRIAKLTQNQTLLDQEKESLRIKYNIDELNLDQNDVSEKILKTLTAGKEATKEQREEAEKIAAVLTDQSAAESGLLIKLKERLEKEEEINDKLGLSGSLVKSLGGAMGKLGLDSKIVADALEDAETAMRNSAESGNSLFPAMAGLKPLAKGFGKALTDPLSIVTAIGKGFLAVNKAQVESIRLTGSAATAMAGFSGKVAATSEVIATSAAATRQLGIDANQLFGNELLTSMTYFQHELGLTGEAATRLGTISKLTGQNIESINSSISEGASEMNALAKSGVPVGIVLQDVLSASDDITASLGNNPKAIAKAATAARALGMDLAKVNSIADGLLDFESSIEAELEAQLLTGKNINLSKARELALNNDLEGVATELAKQGASAAEFANMNRVQQNALAKAMGMSRAELGKMVMTQEQANNLTDEQRAKIQGVTVEQLKSEDVMHRLNRSLAMLGEAFAPMLEAVVPLVTALVKPISLFADFIGMIFAGVEKLNKALGLTNKTGNGLVDWGKSFTAGLIKFAAGGTLLLIGRSIKNALNPKLAGTFMEKLKSGLNPKNLGLKNLKEKIGGLFSKDGAAKITKDAKGKFRDAKGRFAKNPMSKTMDKGAEATGDMQQKTKGAKGKGPKGFLKSLGDGLAHIGKIAKDVIKGAGALAISGLLLGGSFALALRMVKDVDPKVMLAFAGSIGVFAGSLYLVSKVAKDAIKGAAAMAIVGVALIPAAKAFQMMAGVNFAQVALLSGSLIVLGGAAALLGKMSSSVIKGAAALGILGAALIPAAYAFSLLGGTDPAAMATMTGSLLVLGTGAAILGSLASNIIMGAAALGILGLAMIPAAFAFSLLAGVGTDSIIAFSIALPLLGLAAAGLGLLSPFIIAGAFALGVLGLAMIPAAIAFNIMAKADLEKIATGLTAIASVGPQLALAGIGMIALAAGAAVLGLASPMLIFAGAGLAVLGMAAQIASNANIEGIASQLTQLAGIGPGLVAAGIGLFTVAGGMTAFALAMAGASALGALTSMFGGGVMGDLQALAAMAEPLASVGVSLTAIATGLSGIALALSTLETEKINELKGLVMSAASESPLAAATGAITELITGITGGGDQQSSNAALEAKLDELIAAVREGGDVFIDGNKAGNAMLLSSYKSS